MFMKFHFGLRLLTTAALILPFPLVSLAQEEPAFPVTPVKMIVTVEARHGKEVPGIRPEDVLVMQGKQRDKVLSLQPLESSQSSTQLFVLLDDSLSTADLGTKLNDIRGFITSQPANTEIGVAYMRNGTALVAQNLTRDHQQAARALRLPTGEAAGSASPYFSLQDLLKHWPQANAPREVVMISDGIDSYWDGPDLNDPYLESAIHDAQRDGVTVDAIYARAAGHYGHTLWRITLGQNFLSELTDATGGESYYLASDSPVSFTPYFDEINQHLKHRYLLTFQAQPQKKAGFQRVKVSTEVPNAELVAPHEVYVPTGA
jgi:hypothetical protein